jgi:flagellar motility protein MotE (MotC chaperone)
MRQNVLSATENKLDQKVQELQALQAQVSELMKGYDAQENAKFQRLVKIYENMKPREAAKIFDELDMSMLIQIVTRMKEARVAPIIAAMHPSKAKELSIELSKQRSLD